MTIFKDIVYDKNHPESCALDAYFPSLPHTGKVFIYFHGGGLEFGDKGVDYAESFTDNGIALISANYRMYPNAHFPDYINDAAKCVDYVKRNYSDFKEIYVGGSSAGGYLSMMLQFDGRYLALHGIDSFSDIKGYIHDAGQPTTHFNVLSKDMGINRNAIRVDEAAPVFFIDRSFSDKSVLPKMLFFYAENDMPCRKEQTEMLLKTLSMFDYPSERIVPHYMKGCSHCSYTGKAEYLNTVIDFILK